MVEEHAPTVGVPIGYYLVLVIVPIDRVVDCDTVSFLHETAFDGYGGSVHVLAEWAGVFARGFPLFANGDSVHMPGDVFCGV